ncbi:ion transporter [Alteromonas sp. 5E99-2]|uniref:ion transporter n=1 Tax=Alteromonas sp. 5E99-2 TaxID=2817683 RepID=UPI001A988CAC|nr:ion transporter [Alteromonas sp. 5E99-2]MBO1256308.1 ion transporter [Alteromonas sp. 5E99-2]
MLGFSRENLRKSQEAPWLVLDLVMLGIVMFNLLWLAFDALFETKLIHSLIENYILKLVTLYTPVHENFLFVDLVFVAIFLSEFIFRWVVAVVRKDHVRWYFFPFIHWYDLLGCIPVTTTRLFRLLRVFSILYRLHKFKIIDLNRTGIYRFVAFYLDVFIEELSDRIVIKVISDAQKDIASGSPLIEDVQKNVLSPRLPIVSRYIAGILNHLGDSILDSDHGEVIRTHVQQSVGKAVKNNSQVSAFSMLPVVGSTIENTLESAVTDIVTASIINLLSDIDAQRVDLFLRNGMTDFTPEDDAIDDEMMMVINECLELVKTHISSQRWKVELENRSKK